MSELFSCLSKLQIRSAWYKDERPRGLNRLEEIAVANRLDHHEIDGAPMPREPAPELRALRVLSGSIPIRRVRSDARTIPIPYFAAQFPPFSRRNQIASRPHQKVALPAVLTRHP